MALKAVIGGWVSSSDLVDVLNRVMWIFICLKRYFGWSLVLLLLLLLNSERRIVIVHDLVSFLHCFCKLTFFHTGTNEMMEK